MSNAHLLTLQQVITILLTILGLIVALRPPQRATWKEYVSIGAFVILGVVGVWATYVQGKRLDVASEHQQHQLDTIQKNTEQPPKVEVNVPPATVVLPGATKTAGFNILYNGHFLYPTGTPSGSFWEAGREYQFLIFVVNRGPYSAGDVLYAADVEVVEDIQGKPNAQRAWHQFKDKWWKKNENHAPEFWAKDGSATAYALSPKLSTDDYLQISSQKEYIVVLSAVQWNDDEGRHQLDYCAYADSQISQGFPHTECDAHNFVRHTIPLWKRKLD